MAQALYPLTFEPVPVSTPQPGGLLAGYLAPGEPASADEPGRLWLLIDDGAMQSHVSNGPLKGASLGELTRSSALDLVGRRHPEAEPFPFCVGLLNVGATQPLAVHASHRTAWQTPDARPNAKFWHSLAAGSGAQVVAGISRRVTAQQILARLGGPGIRELLQTFPARPGDSFLIAPGMIHSLSAENLVWELQEHNTSPYRVYAWESDAAVDEEERQTAIAAMHVESRQNPRISRESGSATHTRRIPLTLHCPHFSVEEVRLYDHIFLRTTDDSFHIVAVQRGEVTLEWGSEALPLRSGQLCCIPACLGEYKVVATAGPSEFLKVTRPYIP